MVVRLKGGEALNCFPHRSDIVRKMMSDRMSPRGTKSAKICIFRRYSGRFPTLARKPAVNPCQLPTDDICPPNSQLPTANCQLPTAILGQPKYLPHYTLADYQQWSGDWELWDGVAVAMTPSPFGVHQKAITRLAQMLLNELDRVKCNDCEVAVELDWIINTDLVVRPDISICCGSNIDKYIESPPKFIVEVLSSSTQHKDRTAKFDLYANEGVKYYAMVDLDGGRECYELQASRYEKLPNGAVELKLCSGCAIDIDFQ